MKKHYYTHSLQWTGNKGIGTESYVSYDRNFIIQTNGKPIIEGSSDPGFRGDPTRHNPEELLLASVSSCHMLWYLHLCAQESVVVLAYEDQAKGEMTEDKDGSGKFSEITLSPIVTISNADFIEKAIELHQKASSYCFIARSVNFPIHHIPKVSAKFNG